MLGTHGWPQGAILDSSIAVRRTQVLCLTILIGTMELQTMANAKQMLVLKQGAEIWNEWRKNNRGEGVDLSGEDLVGLDLRNIDLGGAELSQANLCGAILSKANFSKANLAQANLDAADLTGSNLCEANLSGTKLIMADLTKANLRKATLMDARLDDASLNEASLRNANLCSACLKQASIKAAILCEANLTKADLREADLSGSNLRKANVCGADFRGANLSEVYLENLIYNRKDMAELYQGIRVDSCYGDAIFKRDAQDQDYIDTLKTRCPTGWRKWLLKAWGWIDFGRSMPCIGGYALLFVMLFGTIYMLCPQLIDHRNHEITTWFTPFYFSFVIYTTLGFGDITARHLAGEILVALEVVLGYLTLGLLLAILANTVARRS